MMDLAALDFSRATAVMPIRHPATQEPLIGDDGKPFTITVKSLDHVDVAKARDAVVDSRVRVGPPRSAKAGRELAVELLIACISDWHLTWNGEQPKCTAENARKLLTEQAWLRDQIDSFVGDRANFDNASRLN